MKVAPGDWSLVTLAVTRKTGLALGCALLLAGMEALAQYGARPGPDVAPTRTFEVRGEVKGFPAGGRAVVIAHEAIPGYMAAMTMPFRVNDPGELAGLQIGDRVGFRLRVSATGSWIEGITRMAAAPEAAPGPRPTGPTNPPPAGTRGAGAPRARNPLLDYPFTNELGHAVRLSDFRGQALGITFFFTRCPIPDYCPRLSRNFEEASQKLSDLPHGPTNWHFLSITFDPEFDTPAVLKSYGATYHYEPKHWNFLTGPKDRIRELAGGSGITSEGSDGAISHNFRTLIIDANGHLQSVFPVSGNLTEAIVKEMLKAAAPPKEAAANPPGAGNARRPANGVSTPTR